MMVEPMSSSNYKDYSVALPPVAASEVHLVSDSSSCFPVRLHDMLLHLEQAGVSHIASWQPHGRSFKVHQPTQFVECILPM